MPQRASLQNAGPPEPHGLGVISARMWAAMGVALLLHLGLLLAAYLSPERMPPIRRRVISMEVVRRTPPPPEPTPPPPEPTPEKKPEERPDQRPARPRLSLLDPVQRPEKKDEPDSPAAVLPAPPEGEKPGGPLKGPIDLFSKDSLGKALGGTGSLAGTPPKTPNRLLEDERLKEKKEEEFHLLPERGGGFKYEGQHFVAHIAPDGALSFDNRFPIGFAKGQSGFSFDLTDLVMRGSKQDPYASQKRRFVEHTAKLREDLRRKKTQATLDSALSQVPADLSEIWQSGKPAGVRRRELFEYWVNCADDKEGSDTQGLRARRQVEEYVRRHLPAESPLAYTDEELRRFAASREGLPVFDPYRSLNR